MPLNPPSGEKISITRGTLSVPSHPIVPYVEGDGTGRDIWRASQRVFDAAVEKAFGGYRKIAWLEVLAGAKGLYTAEARPSQSAMAATSVSLGSAQSPAC